MIESPVDSTVFIDVIALAHQHHVLSVLPAVFYICCREFDLSEILDGLQRPDGSCVTMPSEDIKTCISAREKLIKQQAEATFVWMHTTDTLNFYPFCNNPKQCTSTRKELLFRTFLPGPTMIALDRWCTGWEIGMCIKCSTAAKASHELGRQKIWDDLPSTFGLPEWTELLES